MRRNIVVIGAGSIGRAIEHLVKDKEIRLELWDKDPTKVENQKELGNIIPSAGIIFLCVPSWSLREAIQTIKPHLTNEAIIVGISKGLETESTFRVDQLVQKLLPDNSFVLISGPMLARLIQEDKRSYAVTTISSGNQEALQTIEDYFIDTRLSLEVSQDAASVALAGVLKNIYTLALGIVDALDYGTNVKGWIVSLSIKEMQAIAERLGSDPSVMLGTAGLADLIATGFSPSSNNHRVGRELALHGHTDLQSEGLVSLPSLITLLNNDTNSLPLLHVLKEILNDQAATASTFQKFLKHHSSSE